MSEDVFPQTQQTWIDRRLQEGDSGRSEINHHVMSVYAWPLHVYFLGTVDRWLGEPEDIIDGFFADRLARVDFFDSWRESGLRLRRWLMNAFCFYLMELRRQRRRERRTESLVEDGDVSVRENSDATIDRAFAVAIVRQALSQTREACEASGYGNHWEIFHRHYYVGQEYNDIVADFGIDRVRAATMARTAATRFRRSLRELLARDGATESEIDQELEALLEATG